MAQGFEFNESAVGLVQLPRCIKVERLIFIRLTYCDLLRTRDTENADDAIGEPSRPVIVSVHPNLGTSKTHGAPLPWTGPLRQLVRGRVTESASDFDVRCIHTY